MEGAEYFKANNVTPAYLAARTRTIDDVDVLLWEWGWADNPRHIWRLGLTKSILLLNGMGLALDHCPPSWQVLKFAEEELGRHFSPLLFQGEPPANSVQWSEAFTAIGDTRKVARQLASTIPGVTTADVGNALWYWKSGQNLLTRSPLRKKLSPSMLLVFLKSQKQSLTDFGKEMGDIDAVDQLTSDLKSYLRRIH